MQSDAVEPVSVLTVILVDPSSVVRSSSAVGPSSVVSCPAKSRCYSSALLSLQDPVECSAWLHHVSVSFRGSVGVLPAVL